MSELDEFLSQTADGSFYPGHATVLVRVNGRLLLIDPVQERPLFLDSWLFYPPLAMSPRLQNVDAVLISHFHEDHYDPNFLRSLAPGTPIYMTEGCTGFDVIEQDSSLDTRRLARSDFTEIFDGVKVYTIPSDHNDFDSSFIVKGNGFSLFQGNDNFVARSVVEKAFAATGPIDHAYIPYAYVWWYPFCLTSLGEAERQAEADRLNHMNMDIGLMMAEVLQARHVIPSAGNLVLSDAADSAVNRGIASPFDFKTYADATNPALGDRVRVLVSGDYILEGPSGSRVVAKGYDKERYFELMDEFLTEFQIRNPITPRAQRISEEELAPLRDRVSKFPETNLDYAIYVRRSDYGPESVRIDTGSRRVDVVEADEDRQHELHFDVQGPPFEMWLRGEIPFEVVLNSQRFTVHRKPECFDKPIWDLIRNHL